MRPAGDLLALAADLVAVPSVSRQEAAIADLVEARLRGVAELDVHRLGHNVVGRSHQGRARRVVLAGHLDTVPPAGNDQPTVEGETLSGLGAADMKGGLAVMLALAERVGEWATEVTFVFYEREEVADVENGLRHLFVSRPNLVGGDLAVLLEPTDGWVEAGCQGNVTLRATFLGRRAHTARAWLGSNAVHRVAPVLSRLAAFEAGVVDVDGLSYREGLSVVEIAAGVAANVVPDRATLKVNRRFAPSRRLEEVVEECRSLLAGADEIEVLSAAPGGAPGLGHPEVAGFISAVGAPVRPKLGWTDVARFAAAGIAALNFGPGDPDLAHRPDECVTRTSLEACFNSLRGFLAGR